VRICVFTLSGGDRLQPGIDSERTLAGYAKLQGYELRQSATQTPFPLSRWEVFKYAAELSKNESFDWWVYLPEQVFILKPDQSSLTRHLAAECELVISPDNLMPPLLVAFRNSGWMLGFLRSFDFLIGLSGADQIEKEKLLDSMLEKARGTKGTVILAPEWMFAKTPSETDGAAIFADLSFFSESETEQILKRHAPLRRPKPKSKVSCVMVTRGNPALVKRSVNCFLSQTYPNCELIAVGNESDETSRLFAGFNDDRIRFLGVSQTDIRLGELRNISIEAASGEYVMQWDDDDWYHPDRVKIQLAGLQYTGSDACFLNRWTLAWPSRGLYMISKRRLWEGSMIAVREKLERYQPGMALGEDTELLNRLIHSGRQLCCMDNPWLYIYCVHGENSYSVDHFQNNIFNDWSERLSPEQIVEVQSRLTGNGMPIHSLSPEVSDLL
jgi:hypothetical protein